MKARTRFNKLGERGVHFSDDKAKQRNGIELHKAAWVDSSGELVLSRPPSAMMVTSIDQSRQLEQIYDIELAHAPGLTSQDWLQNHSLAVQELTLQDILREGIPLRPQITNVSDKPILHLKYYSTKLLEYKAKLIRFIQICNERVKWLLKDSRRAFGLIKASQPCILVDTSDTNCGFGRLELLQDSFKQLINEQLSKMDRLYIAAFGTYLEPLWSSPRDVNHRVLDEAKYWVNTLQPSGSCNVLGALQQLIKWKTFDAFVIILGNCPNQQPDLIIEFVREAMCGRNVPFHTVAYNCSISSTNMFLKNLSALTGGQYHCYSTTNESQIMSGSDLQLLYSEIDSAKDVLIKVDEMIDSHKVGAIKLTVMDQISRSFYYYCVVSQPAPSRELMETISSKELVLVDDEFVVIPSKSEPFPKGTSADWLKENCLRAKGLTLYQVIAPNAYSYVNGFISSINREVKSQVHHKCMVQFEWHDGSTKNVHVDPVLLFEYQHALQNAVHLYRRRIEWLMSGSRKMFGTIIEERVVLLIDMSYAVAGDFAQVQQYVKTLLQEQLSEKISFNMICIGGAVAAFKPAMVEPTPQTLKEAWRWFLNQPCSGSRKFLNAFMLATENEEEKQLNIEVAGLYFITSGIPDEPKAISCSYVEESLIARPCNLHCIYIEPTDNDPRTIVGQYADTDETVEYLRELSASGRGRFHWLKENVVVESEDIKSLICEMDKAHNYSKKTSMLLESVKRKEENAVLDNSTPLQLVPKPPNESSGKLKPVRQTQLSKARISNGRPQSASYIQSQRKARLKERPHSSKLSESGSSTQMAWKPNNLTSSTNLIPPASSKTDVQKKKEHIVKSVERVFYTELGNQTGSILEHVPTLQERKRKALLDSEISEKEEVWSSREWMQSFGLSKLKLDLNSAVETSPCLHGEGKSRGGEWRHCTIFPTMVIKGSLRHIHMKPRELAEYEDQLEKILARYTKRLKWLLTGSRKIFGVVIEKSVVIVIDTSGSMAVYLEELKLELNNLIREQIQKNNIRFNMLKFSSSVDSWNAKLCEPLEHHCQGALKWVEGLEAYGGTNTLDALKAAFEDDEVEGIYFLTDGKPDQSTTSVLREAASLNASRRVRIHAISFNCSDSSANHFLRLLASQSEGRYHCYQEENKQDDTLSNQLWVDGAQHKSLDQSNLEGDDIKRVWKEILLCRKYLKKVKKIRDAIEIADSGSYTDSTKGEALAR